MENKNKKLLNSQKSCWRLKPDPSYGPLPCINVLHACLDCSCSLSCVLAVSVPPDSPARDTSDELHLTDQLLNKCEKEQTNYDVQIGDGMDIVIVGENGKINTLIPGYN